MIKITRKHINHGQPNPIIHCDGDQQLHGVAGMQATDVRHAVRPPQWWWHPIHTWCWSGVVSSNASQQLHQ